MQYLQYFLYILNTSDIDMGGYGDYGGNTDWNGGGNGGIGRYGNGYQDSSGYGLSTSSYGFGYADGSGELP